MNCPVCTSPNHEVFLSRLDVPTLQDVVFTTPQSAQNARRGDLRMDVCRECGFVWNSAFNPVLTPYGANYDNSQTYSSSFRTYVEGLVSYLVNERGVHNQTVLEIGSGNGYFLTRLCEVGDNVGFGFDPAYQGDPVTADNRCYFQSELYVDQTLTADVVICRHVIEHVPDPVALLRTVFNAVKHSPSPLVIFETPDVEWILHNRVIWDFYYEHCSLFSWSSIQSAFAMAGFTVERVKRVFGDQYLWAEAKPGQALKLYDPNVWHAALDLKEAELGIQVYLLARLEELRQRGSTALLGAGAKCVTLADLFDRERTLIDVCVDLSPRKKYLPGTGHAIVNYEMLAERRVKQVLLLNANYVGENLTLLNGSSTLVNGSSWCLFNRPHG